MDTPDTIRLVGSLCMPSVVITCRSVNRLFNSIFPQTVIVSDGKQKVQPRINDINHGYSILQTSNRLARRLSIDGVQVLMLTIYNELGRISYSGPDSKYTDIGAKCIYTIITGSIRHGTVTSRIDLNADFEIVSFASEHTAGLLKF